MNDQTDSQLLRAYAEQRAEAAFAELVRRHVDLVYSAALRMVCDSHLAQDVTQGVFVALAKQASQLVDRPALSGWLHGTAKNIAAQTVRTDVRRRAREQEAATMNELLAEDSDVHWEQIAPHLDTALSELNELDRDALMLRYFERKSAREIAQVLGLSDDAAQKRVSRAVERLREFFSKRNVTIGASGLAVLISANAVQSAPLGLAATISAAAVLTGTAISTSTAVAVTKTIAMTTIQKAFITAALVATVGAGIFEAHQAAQLRAQNQILQRQQTPLAEQIRQLQRERDDATNRLVELLAENAQFKSHSDETALLKLRGEIGVLRQQNDELQKLQKDSHQLQDDNHRLKQQLTENEITSKQFAGEIWMRALIAYANNNQRQLPENLAQAEPSLPMELIDAAPDQYEMLYHGSLDSLTNSDAIVFREKKLWRTENGRLGRFDILASGRAQYSSAPDGTPDSDLSDYEKENTAPITSQ